MSKRWILTLTMALILASCGPGSGSPASPTPATGLSPASLCGDGTCESSENAVSCPRDCPAAAFSGQIRTTTIRSEDLDIAVMVASPQTPRYAEGAGVVVVAAPIFSETTGFMTTPDLTSLGLVQVSYLWPGETDSLSGASSSGTFDYGGEQSVHILRDVIRFAANRLADENGRYLVSMTSVPPLIEEVGVYAFSDAGIAAVRAFSLYGNQFQGLGYFVGREVPTVDTISSMELGYTNDAGQAVFNPFYIYPASYSTTALTLSYPNLSWDPAYTSRSSKVAGRAYLDLDGNGSINPGDMVFDGPIPVMFGKRHYSSALTTALRDSGALSLDGWPDDMATPEEAAQDWDIRQTSDLFIELQSDEILKNMKVMLVFAQNDHAQVAKDKPHIHQLYQGFRFEARLWVRLNPDRVYVDAMFQNAAPALQGKPEATPTPARMSDFPDNPANTQPSDWLEIGAYAYPGSAEANRLVPLAAVAEMADREHAGFWTENLGQVLYPWPVATPQP